MDPYLAVISFASFAMATVSSIEFTTGQQGKQNAIKNAQRYSLDRKGVAGDGLENAFLKCDEKARMRS